MGKNEIFVFLYPKDTKGTGEHYTNIQAYKPYIYLDIQRVIDNHSKVFDDILENLLPTGDIDHAIHLILGSSPPNIKPYMYPYA